MSKLPSVSSEKIIKRLLKAGFDYAPIKGKGSHRVIIPKRDPVPKGTLISIIKQSGMTREEFIKLLE